MRQATWRQAPWPGSSQGLGAPGLKSLMAALALEPGQPIRWILAPSLMHHWLQIPPLHTASLAELHAVALARATQLFGPGTILPSDDEAGWTVAGEWHATRPFLCAAIATRLHQALQLELGRAPALFSPLMLTMSRYQRQFPRQGWLAVALAQELHVMHFEGGRARRLRSVRVAPEATPSQVESLALMEWQREKLRAQSSDMSLHWLHLTLSPNSPSSAALKPIRINLPSQTPSRGSATLDSETLSEAQHAAWCGQVLFAAQLA